MVPAPPVNKDLKQFRIHILCINEPRVVVKDCNIFKEREKFMETPENQNTLLLDVEKRFDPRNSSNNDIPQLKPKTIKRRYSNLSRVAAG